MARVPSLLVALAVGFLSTAGAQAATDSTDFGACPTEYEAAAAAAFKGGVLAGYRGDPMIWPPRRWTYRTTPVSRPQHGYLVPVAIDQTRGNPNDLGFRLRGLLFRDGEIVARLNAIRMANFDLGDLIGPLPLDDSSWTVGHSTEQQGHVVVEWVRTGETVQAWTELITLLTLGQVPYERPLTAVVETIRASHQRDCNDVTLKVLSSTPTTLLLEQRLAGCTRYPEPEESIRKLFRGATRLSELSYSSRAPLTDEQRAAWTGRIDAAGFLSACVAR